ncbi:putative TRAFAC class TrmE-Era-EngA-EngB-Septin- like GTPase superfamily, septin GTPase family protein [Lyophyllum shimeji]|uniref:TRAFAC class TrmE-Era-EngA-EngB-Septin-like GTPase superfamily, septin GTPase family protein n=1 Tax=Lyophyllum shimeji TaxID=47721 RepID=A0A9P3UPI8_LYOSH|nr:putative TRAFAC class TrmE-Era-EngA-EngB-Septin- like GTPase superfamily, septin GTPase family protein [Lyophyllum shimeji]
MRTSLTLPPVASSFAAPVPSMDPHRNPHFLHYESRQLPPAGRDPSIRHPSPIDVPASGIVRSMGSLSLPSQVPSQRYASPIYSDPHYHATRPERMFHGSTHNYSVPVLQEAVHSHTSWREGEAGPSSLVHAPYDRLGGRRGSSQPAQLTRHIDTFGLRGDVLDGDAGRYSDRGRESYPGALGNLGQPGGGSLYSPWPEPFQGHAMHASRLGPDLTPSQAPGAYNPYPLTSVGASHGGWSGTPVSSGFSDYPPGYSPSSVSDVSSDGRPEDEGDDTYSAAQKGKKRRRDSDVGDDGTKKGRNPRKTAVACNFCRGRKLRCNGAKPSCSNCTVRRFQCEYVPVQRRRGPGKAPKGSKSKKASSAGRPEPSTSQPPGDGGSVMREATEQATTSLENFSFQASERPTPPRSESSRRWDHRSRSPSVDGPTNAAATTTTTAPTPRQLPHTPPAVPMAAPAAIPRRSLGLSSPCSSPAAEEASKTSFLRLLLDTSTISPTATKEQLANVAKFVQGCNGHTSYIRPTSIDINVDLEGTGQPQQIGLHLVDTPSLDFKDENSAEWSLSEILRNVDSRFAEGVENEWNVQKADRYVHLCIYFLDPDQIVPPSVPGPSAPLVPRTRTNSFSHTEQEPVILEPPLTTNPLLLRPTLPLVEIDTIRRLSARVNVLPVISRADILSNERLAAVKVAIRRDLAEAGIGFGIFDMDTPYQQHLPDDPTPAKNGEASNGYGASLNGSVALNNHTPPTSPITPAHLRLPYALISPDMYSHSDGVARPPPSRAELIQQYTASSQPSYSYPSNIVRGKFIRSYRWGVLDVLDPAHSDFLALRAAIFHHMDTLQKYTREYLFDKFRAEYLRQQQPQRPATHLSVPHHLPQGMALMGSLSHGSRPILAIDTAPHQSMHRHPSLSGPRDILAGDMRSGQRPMPESVSTSASARGSSRSTKQRTKKITVACNFCRSRKLKCDGGRPACSQCVKRSHPCDYMPQNKRRGAVRQRKDDESESESGEDRSADHDEASASPEVPSQPLSRRSSNVDKLSRDGFAPLPQIAVTSNRRERDEAPLPGPSSLRSKPPHHGETRSLFPDNELPHIATLSLPEPSPSTPVPMSAPSLPPLRPASEQQAAQRKRAATVPGKIPRTAANSGPKVVACNFCRARKTKCDGAHPACASCARRSLPCNYVHDSGPSGQGQKKGRRASNSSKPPVDDSPRSVSPPSSRMVPTPSTGHDGYDPREGDIYAKGELDLKRPIDYPEAGRPPKKMRMESSPASAGIP